MKNAAYFTLQGRLNRKKFFKRYLVTSIFMFCISVFIMIQNGLTSQILVNPDALIALLNNGQVNLEMILFNLPFYLYMLSLDWRRWHDLNAPNLLILASIVGMIDPYITKMVGPDGLLGSISSILQLAILIPLFFFKGTAGTNYYGEDLLTEAVADTDAANEKPAYTKWQRGLMGIVCVYVLLAIVSILIS